MLEFLNPVQHPVLQPILLVLSAVVVGSIQTIAEKWMPVRHVTFQHYFLKSMFWTAVLFYVLVMSAAGWFVVADGI
ncbi:MAG: hypothetical protein JSS57_16630 [Proteobacteria bacterium]|nr:hypothetical protein [Pseudomonadota bacterium]